MRNDFEIALDLRTPVSDDLKFIESDGVQTALMRLSEKTENGRLVVLSVVKDAQSGMYSIGQVRYEDVDEIEENEYALRNIRLFMDEFDVPKDINVTNNMIGPTFAVGVAMLMKLVYATFSGDNEHRNQIIYDLNIMSHRERGLEAPEPPTADVVSLFC